MIKEQEKGIDMPISLFITAERPITWTLTKCVARNKGVP